MHENASHFQIAGRCMLCMLSLTLERDVFVVLDKVLFKMASERLHGNLRGRTLSRKRNPKFPAGSVFFR